MSRLFVESFSWSHRFIQPAHSRCCRYLRVLEYPAALLEYRLYQGTMVRVYRMANEVGHFVEIFTHNLTGKSIALVIDSKEICWVLHGPELFVSLPTKYFSLLQLLLRFGLWIAWRRLDMMICKVSITKVSCPFSQHWKCRVNFLPSVARLYPFS